MFSGIFIHNLLLFYLIHNSFQKTKKLPVQSICYPTTHTIKTKVLQSLDQIFKIKRKQYCLIKKQRAKILFLFRKTKILQTGQQTIKNTYIWLTNAYVVQLSEMATICEKIVRIGLINPKNSKSCLQLNQYKYKKTIELNSGNMNVKQSKSTICSQDTTVNLESIPITKNFIQIYKIKVQDMKTSSSKKQTQKNIYLNIKFDDQTSTIIQTQCIDIINDNKFYEIKTKTDIEKIEVLNYDSLKKLSKISLKGIKKEFKHTHTEEKSQIQVEIERTHVDLEFFNRKCKLTESVIIDQDQKQKDSSSTDDSSSQVSN